MNRKALISALVGACLATCKGHYQSPLSQLYAFVTHAPAETSSPGTPLRSGFPTTSQQLLQLIESVKTRLIVVKSIIDTGISEKNAAEWLDFVQGLLEWAAPNVTHYGITNEEVQALNDHFTLTLTNGLAAHKTLRERVERMFSQSPANQQMNALLCADETNELLRILNMVYKSSAIAQQLVRHSMVLLFATVGIPDSWKKPLYTSGTLHAPEKYLPHVYTLLNQYEALAHNTLEFPAQLKALLAQYHYETTYTSYQAFISQLEYAAYILDRQSHATHNQETKKYASLAYDMLGNCYTLPLAPQLGIPISNQLMATILSTPQHLLGPLTIFLLAYTLDDVCRQLARELHELCDTP